MYSIAFTLLTTYLYNLFQETNRNRLFHCLLYLYSSLFALLSLISPTRSVYTSYLNFLLTESYGSLVTAHFWGFCNAHVEFQDRVYPIIIGMAQIGAMLGGFGASGGDDISRRYFVGGCLGPIGEKPARRADDDATLIIINPPPKHIKPRLSRQH